MTTPRFIQLHFLASYPGALLNRDDAGLAKRLPFGGATRTRVSSQCLKRHWRMAHLNDHKQALQNIDLLSDKDFGNRSRRIFERMARELAAEPFEPAVAAAAVAEVVARLVQRVFEPEDAPKPKKEQDDPFRHLRFDQAFLIGRPEYEYLKELCRKVLKGDAETTDAFSLKRKSKSAALTKLQKEIKAALDKNLEELRKQAKVPQSVEAALFGRMVTSDLMANWDAAIHVAHAFTVHDEQQELDYFTVVDDLKDPNEDDAGAAGVFDTELTSGLYYGYVVVDVPLLVSNLTGADRKGWAAPDVGRDLAGRVVENLVHLVATVSPGAKKGSTAPYAYAELVLAEMGERQPRTLANAFRDPVRPPRSRAELEAGETLAGRTAKAMAEELAGLDGMFGTHEARLQAGRGASTLPRVLGEEGKPDRLAAIDRATLPDLATRLREAVRRAEA